MSPELLLLQEDTFVHLERTILSMSGHGKKWWGQGQKWKNWLLLQLYTGLFGYQLVIESNLHFARNLNHFPLCFVGHETGFCFQMCLRN